jgi:hypothetical protein
MNTTRLQRVLPSQLGTGIITATAQTVSEPATTPYPMRAPPAAEQVAPLLTATTLPPASTASRSKNTLLPEHLRAHYRA